MFGRVTRAVLLGLMLVNIAWIANMDAAIAHNPDIPDFAAPGLVLGKMVVLLMVGLDYVLAFVNILLKRYEFAKFALFGATLLVVMYCIEAMLWATRHQEVWNEFAIWTIAGIVHVGTALWYQINGKNMLEEEELEEATVQRMEEEEDVPELEMKSWKDEPKF